MDEAGVKWSYSYDLLKRLRCIQKGGTADVQYIHGPEGSCTFDSAASDRGVYTYDPLNRLYKQSVNGVVTSYLYDGAEPMQDYAGEGTSGVVIHRFVNGVSAI